EQGFRETGGGGSMRRLPLRTKKFGRRAFPSCGRHKSLQKLTLKQIRRVRRRAHGRNRCAIRGPSRDGLRGARKKKLPDVHSTDQLFDVGGGISLVDCGLCAGLIPVDPQPKPTKQRLDCKTKIGLATALRTCGAIQDLGYPRRNRSRRGSSGGDAGNGQKVCR